MTMPNRYSEQLQDQWEAMLSRSWHPSQWWVERSDMDAPDDPGEAGEVKMWVYRQDASRGLWLVGFYEPQGTWHLDSEHDERSEAAARVHYLNGGSL